MSETAAVNMNDDPSQDMDEQLTMPDQVGPPADSPPQAISLTTDEVIARYQHMVYSVSLTHTRCRGDADDVFQEVFLTYHLKQPPCTDEEHLKAWLLRVTLTCARRISTSSWRTRVVPLTEEDAEATPTVFHFEDPRQDEVFEALSSLPETYRTVVHLFYIEDLPTAQIASALAIAPGTVKMRLTRGRAMMRNYLKENSHD